jgi:hypothetical protein
MRNRDLRAGGITEGGIAEASIEDRRKVAGHTTNRMTATIYDDDPPDFIVDQDGTPPIRTQKE